MQPRPKKIIQCFCLVAIASACDVKVQSKSPAPTAKEAQALLEEARRALQDLSASTSLDHDDDPPTSQNPETTTTDPSTDSDSPPVSDTPPAVEADEKPIQPGNYHFLMERDSVTWQCTRRDGSIDEYIKSGVVKKGGTVLEWRYVFSKNADQLELHRKTIDDEDFNNEWQASVPVGRMTNKRIWVRHSFEKGKAEYTNSTDTISIQGTTQDEGETYKGHYQVINKIHSGSYKECNFDADFILSVD